MSLREAGADRWLAALQADPIDWLLQPADPAVRHLTLLQLLDRPADDREVMAAARAAMVADPIAAILAAQDPLGFWQKPGPGYATKYRGTVWQVIFLEQLGADPGDQRVQRACDYVLAHSQAQSGGFGSSGAIGATQPPPSAVIHCLNGNLLRALIGLGRLDDERVARAIDWEARAITGEGIGRWYASGTSGPGFACAANEGLPCAWGAVKAIRGLAAVPAQRRTPVVRRAIEAGRGIPAEPRSIGCRLPGRLGQHPAERLMVQARLSLGLCRRRAAGPRGPRRARVRARSEAGPGDRLAARETRRRRPLEERVRLQRQDLGRFRAAG